MWFASIWIFTLELPWQLGAEFFMKHLYDGDAASNTLGWRWVATHLQPRVFDAASPSYRCFIKNSAPSCHGNSRVKIQILANHILVWLCR